MSKALKGVLLINLGTPKSAQNGDVFTYLNEFLTDGRVIDKAWLPRQLLVRGIIVPFRFKDSAKIYREIWDTKTGSPLMYHSVNLTEKVKAKLSSDYVVELAMRYQEPSIPQALERLKAQNISELIVIPMYPQYASSSTGTALQKVLEEVSKWNNIPAMKIVSSYYNDEGYINAFVKKIQDQNLENYDHILFSYHGLPLRHLLDGDTLGNHCHKDGTFSCCEVINEKNAMCYRAQCVATTKAIVQKLQIPKEKHSIAFQSRLGKEEWVQPYAVEAIDSLAKSGVKKLLVISPAFTADCLETVYEIAIEYDEDFKKLGGEKIQLVESLNDSDEWVDTILRFISENSSK